MYRKKNLLVLLTGILLCSTLACRTATSFVIPKPFIPLPAAPLIAPASTAASVQDAGTSCRSLLKDIVNVATTSGSYTEPEEEQNLVTYQVIGDEITNPQFESIPVDLTDAQHDLATQEKTWNYFAALIPPEQRSMVSTYAVITDGKANLLSAVSQSDDDPTRWALEVDIADSPDYYNLSFTLIHESGHLLTLNADQVPPSQGIFSRRKDNKVHDLAASLCPNYFPGEGCSRADSYINQFYQRFWIDFYDEWNQVDQTQDAQGYYDKLNQFYKKYHDQFVTDYAATDPAEDIAESWAYFVLTPKPDGDTIAEEKVLFFYQYPQLVSLRDEIRNRTCTAFPR